MIRRIKIVLVAVCLVLFFFLALALVFQRSDWSPLSTFGAQAIESISPTLQIVILLLTVVMILAIGVLQLLELRSDVLITREGEEGSVTIVESAIARYIRQVATDMDAVESVRTRITNTPQGLAVDLYAKVIVTDTLVRIEQAIRAKVREALEQTLGVGGVATINVIVENFKKVPSRPEQAGRETASGGATRIGPRGPSDSDGGESEAPQYVHLVQRPEAPDVSSESPGETAESEPSERNR